MIGATKVRMGGSAFDGTGMSRLIARGRRVIEDSGQHLKTDAQDIIQAEAYATGDLHDSVQIEVYLRGVDKSGVPSKLIGAVGSSVRYAKFVEQGRKPGRNPTLAGVEAWLRAVNPDLGDSDRRARAFHVMAVVKKRGIAPVRMFERAAGEEQPTFLREMNNVVHRFAEGR